jgi:hypothetical protein
MLSSADDMETLAVARTTVREFNNEGANMHDFADLVLDSSLAPAHSTIFSEESASQDRASGAEPSLQEQFAC